MWVRGYADVATEAAFERAVTLATSAGTADQLDIAQTGLAFVSMNRADLARAHALLTEMLARAETRGDHQRAGGCHNELAIIAHHRGDFASSLALAERAAAVCDPVHGKNAIGGNQAVASLCFGAGLAAFMLGFAADVKSVSGVLANSTGKAAVSLARSCVRRGVLATQSRSRTAAAKRSRSASQARLPTSIVAAFVVT